MASIKTELINRRRFKTKDEARSAIFHYIEAFIDLYKEQWLPEKNGFLSTSATGEAWYTHQADGVAA